MKGKKIGILIAVLASLSMLAIPASVSAGAAYTLTATPTTAAWGDTEYISIAVHGVYWNGTATCTLTDPNGNDVGLGDVALTGVTPAATEHYANWTYMPNVPGTWTVTIEFTRTSGSGTLTTQTGSFDQERTMISVARDLNVWSGLILYVVAVLAVIILLVIMVSKVADRGKKVD